MYSDEMEIQNNLQAINSANFIFSAFWNNCFKNKYIIMLLEAIEIWYYVYQLNKTKWIFTIKTCHMKEHKTKV